MYDELVKKLRHCENEISCNDCEYTYHCGGEKTIIGEAADAIEELAGLVQEAERDRDEYRERLDKANDAVEELSEQLENETEYATALNSYVPQWISVKDALPEEDGDYLVSYEEGYREDYGFDEIGIAPFEVDCEGFGIWQEHFDHYTLGSLGTEWVDIPVTHWMPLPEPPKEET